MVIGLLFIFWKYKQLSCGLCSSFRGCRYLLSYFDRLGRSSLGYGGSRSSMSSQDSHGLYGSRQGMGYGGGVF